MALVGNIQREEKLPSIRVIRFFAVPQA